LLSSFHARRPNAARGSDCPLVIAPGP
jgi:hypothetical protein